MESYLAPLTRGPADRSRQSVPPLPIPPAPAFPEIVAEGPLGSVDTGEPRRIDETAGFRASPSPHMRIRPFATHPGRATKWARLLGRVRKA